MIAKSLPILFLAFNTLALASQPAAAFYRYLDGQGRTQLSDHIPPKFASKGYEVLDARMFVIRVVPPEMTPAEIAARDAKIRAERAAAEQAERDRNLLLQFPRLTDLNGAEQRELDRLERQLRLIERQRDSHRNTLTELRRQAARIERSGQATDEVSRKIEAREALLEKAEALEQAKQLEIASTRASYERKRLRIVTLRPNE